MDNAVADEDEDEEDEEEDSESSGSGTNSLAISCQGITLVEMYKSGSKIGQTGGTLKENKKSYKNPWQ